MKHVNTIKMAKTTPLFSSKNFEDTFVLSKVNEIFRQKRGFVYRMPKPETPVLLIVSGGLDSVLLWFRLLYTYKLRVYPVFFTYPFYNSNSIPGEWDSVRFFYSYFKKRCGELVMPIKSIPVDLSFSLTSKKNIQILRHNWRVAIANAKQEVQTQKASAYILDYPNRFARFALSAYEYGLSLQARGIDVSTLFFGIVPNDASIGREPTLSVLRSLNMYICLVLGDWKWQINAPIDKTNSFYFTKEQSILFAQASNLPIHKTWSCVNKLPFHCGWCNACRYRQASFVNAKIHDKTIYLVTPSMKHFIKKIFAHFFSKKRVVRKNVAKVNKSLSLPVLSPRFCVRLYTYIEIFQQEKKYFLRNPNTEEILQINEVGGMIVSKSLSRPGISIKSLVVELKKQFPHTPKSRLLKDTQSFVGVLTAKQFVQLKT